MDNKYIISPTTEGFIVLVYGAPGAGKTLFSASGHGSAHLSPILFLNSDHGLDTVAHINSDYIAEDMEPPLRQYPVDSLHDLEHAARELLKADGNRADPFNGVKTIVFDSLTAFRDSVMRSEAETQATKTGARRTNPDANELQDYNVVLNALMRNLIKLRQTGLNMVFTAGESINPEGKVAADLNPAMARYMNRFVSYYWRMKIAPNGQRGLSVMDKGGSTSIVKTRGVPFSRALAEITNDNGTYVIEDEDFPTMKFLHDLYIKTTQGEI